MTLTTLETPNANTVPNTEFNADFDTNPATNPNAKFDSHAGTASGRTGSS